LPAVAKIDKSRDIGKNTNGNNNNADRIIVDI